MQLSKGQCNNLEGSVTMEILVQFSVVGKFTYANGESWVVQLSPHCETEEEAQLQLEWVKRDHPSAAIRKEQIFI